MITIKKIKAMLKETNTASGGGIRGLGAVTGTAGGGQQGNLDNWISQNLTGSQENNQAHQSLAQTTHFDLHDVINSNDINPKDKNKKVIIKQEQ